MTVTKKRRYLMNKYEAVRKGRNNAALALAGAVESERNDRVNVLANRALGVPSCGVPFDVFDRDYFLCAYEGAERALGQVRNEILAELGITDDPTWYGDMSAEDLVAFVRKHRETA